MSEEQGTATPGKLDARFEPLAVAVAMGDTIKTAAEKAGIPLSTAYHTSCGEDFKARVAELRGEVTEQALGCMTDGLVSAVQTIIALLDESQEPKVRLDAAKALLVNVRPLTDTAEFRARLEKIERKQKGNGK